MQGQKHTKKKGRFPEGKKEVRALQNQLRFGETLVKSTVCLLMVEEVSTPEESMESTVKLQCHLK